MNTKSQNDVVNNTTNSEADAYNLTNDLLFRKTFGDPKNSNLLLSLVNSVFEQRNIPLLKTITDLNPISIGDNIDAKTIILDIKAKSDDGKVINVEMHHEGMITPVKRGTSRNKQPMRFISGEGLNAGVEPVGDRARCSVSASQNP